MRFGIAFLVIVSGAVAACGSKPDAEESADAPAADESAPAEGAPPALALIDACTVRMTQPDAREWRTKWDPAHTRPDGDNPSGVRSTHWANEAELKSATEMGVVVPLDLVCGSDRDEEGSILLNLVAYDSSLTEIPLAPGEYPIAPKASPAKNKPGEFILAGLFLGKSMFEANSGTLKLTRFDGEGVAGSFVIDGNEILMGSRPLHVEGTFDMPCRRGMLQTACESDKAELPN